MVTNARQEKVRARQLSESPVAVTQPTRPEVRGGGSPFLHAVIRGIPGPNARYVTMQFVKPSGDFETTGRCEFLPGTTRPVLCDIGTRGASDYAHWLWEGPESEWSAAIVPLKVYTMRGHLYVMQLGRFQFVTETGGYAPTDCYLRGVG